MLLRPRRNLAPSTRGVCNRATFVNSFSNTARSDVRTCASTTSALVQRAVHAASGRRGTPRRRRRRLGLFVQHHQVEQLDQPRAGDGFALDQPAHAAGRQFQFPRQFRLGPAGPFVQRQKFAFSWMLRVISWVRYFGLTRNVT